MTLVVVTNDFGPRSGGIESFVHALLERLPRGSFLVFTSAQAHSEEFDRSFTATTGAPVVRARSRVLLPTPRVQRQLRGLVRVQGAEAVWFAAAAPLALMAGRLRKAGVKKVVASTHGHEVWWAKVPIMRAAIRRIGASVDVLTYLGEYTRSVLEGALRPQDRSKLTRLAPGVDLHHFSARDGAAIRDRHHLGNSPVIVCVSRLVHRKGQDRLIAALKQVRLAIPDARLLLVGKGPRRHALEAMARRLELLDAVTFADDVPYAELPAYYSAGSLFVMPTRSRLAGLEVEGLGMVYLEASACNLAVVAGRSGGSPDALLAGITGELVNDNVDEIAATIIRLLRDPDRCREMGASGRSWVESQWDWSNVAATFTHLVSVDRDR